VVNTSLRERFQTGDCAMVGSVMLDAASFRPGPRNATSGRMREYA
jgi:hypothetical protein